jgi:cell division septum initiation protein DivIVA
MTEKELKNLNRADLLEMLLSLSKENEQLKEQLEEAQKKVENKKITVKQLGNIAEASLQLNGVFTAAQAACDQYIENVKMMVTQHKKQCAKQEKETTQECERMLQEASQQSVGILAEANGQYDSILAEANQQYQDIVEEANQYADNIVTEAQQKCDAIWEGLYEKIKEATGYDFDMKYLLYERFGVDMDG